MAKFGREIEPGRVVILAGLAGSLCGDIRAGDACAIASVRDQHGAKLRPPLILNAPAPITVVSANDVVIDLHARRELARTFHAHLIDLESAAFAQQASERGWRWGIIRAVSDDLTSSLPADIGEWIDARGRARPLRIARAILQRPGTLREMRSLRAASRRALRQAAALLDELLRNFCET